jgi:deoxyribose-phosphate aldolase
MPDTLTRAALAATIDHTALKPETSAAQIDRLCDEAALYGFAAVCVNPLWVARCAARLAGRMARVCTVAGFPLGASLSDAKAFEAGRAVEQGAHEVDMVVDLAALQAGDRAAVTRDIEAVVAAVRRVREDACVKVIVESATLSDEQIVLACRCVAEAQADYIKTSTGFHQAGGAKVEHVALMHKHIAPLKVKAAGGIRDLATARAMLAAGATRLGMSASVAVLGELAG